MIKSYWTPVGKVYAVCVWLGMSIGISGMLLHAAWENFHAPVKVSEIDDLPDMDGDKRPDLARQVWFLHRTDVNLRNIPKEFHGERWVIFTDGRDCFAFDSLAPAYDAEVEMGRLEQGVRRGGK